MRVCVDCVVHNIPLASHSVDGVLNDLCDFTALRTL